MTPDEFEQIGRDVMRWVADYHRNVEKYPVLSTVRPGEVRSQLPDHPPLRGESMDAVLKDLDRIILPGVTHWQSPNFFAYFPANTSGPAILGDLVSSGLGVQGMLWATSPACTELETHVLDWMAEMLGLPELFTSRSSGGGVILDSASSASLGAILAARERATQFRSNEEGLSERLVGYVSDQAHSSIEKGMTVAGIGRSNLRLIGTDDRYAMRPDLLEEQIRKDRSAGLRPFFVAATVGTTSSHAMDPLRSIGEVCRREGLWFHVDAAHAGTAAIAPEFRAMHDGLELADSYCFNPHKWMFTTFDCDCFYVADRASLIKTLSILPEYLKNKATESGAVIDYRDWQIPLGRRFRSLKLWFVIRWYGVEGLQYFVRQHVAAAQEFARWVEADPVFELAAPTPLNLVTFRHRKGDEATRTLQERLNASGDLYLSHTLLGGKHTLRMSIGGTWTERRHVERAWRRIQEEGRKV
jgi:aromatic-L-amino-acid decarboxylase